MILQNWRTILTIVMIAIMAGLGLYIKFLNGRIDNLITEKENIQSKLDISQASIKSLQIAINEQNAAVDKMQIDANNREKAHQQEIIAAKMASNNFKKKADDLMASIAPQNISKCDAANQLINETIKNEK